MADKWYKKIGDKKTYKKKVKCRTCKQEVEHTIVVKYLGNPDDPILQFKSTCSNCGIILYRPFEPS